MDIAGIKVTNANTNKLSNIKGIVDLTTSAKSIFNALHVTNRFCPNGGVDIPIARFVVTTFPKCIGSMPAFMAKENTIGMIITIAEPAPINIPAIKNNRLITNSTAIGEVVPKSPDIS